MKTTLDNSFLSIKDHDYLSELIYDYLADKGTFPQCIEDFKITIEYTPEEILEAIDLTEEN